MRIGKLAATLWLVMLPSFGARAADIRISDLPLGTASSTGTNDSFPYVDAAGGTTRRLKLSDVKNIPSMVGQYAPLNSPAFVGPVTAPSGFVGPLTGNVTGNLFGNADTATQLAANPTDCGANTFAVSIDSHGNLTCSSVPDAALASSYVYADGSRGLTGPWNAGQSITAPTFIGALTGNASTATALAANPTDCGAGSYATSIDAMGNLACGPALSTLYVNRDGSTALTGPWSAGQAITAPSFVGPLTGNASTATALAANPTDCASNFFATSIDASGNLSCSRVGDAGLQNSYILTDGSRSLLNPWNAGQAITAPSFIGALTGNSSTSSALAATPVGCSPGTVASSIAANGNLSCIQVSNSTMINMFAHTFKGNNTGSTGPVLDLTATQLTAELNPVVGDTGSGGTKGLVPAPAAGDAAASKFLKADGTWATAGGGGSPAVLTNHYFVDPAGDDSTGDGSLEKPWLTLTHAEAAITTESDTNIFVIHVAPGDYVEGGATTLAFKPNVIVLGSVQNPDAVRFDDAITFQPFGVSANSFAMLAGIKVGAITASSYPGGATLKLDHVHVTGDVNLSHRFQRQYLSYVNVDGGWTSQGDALGGVLFVDHVNIGLDMTVDQVVAGGAAMELHALALDVSGGTLTFGHTENAYLYSSNVANLAISGTGHTVSLYTDHPLDGGVGFSTGVNHFKILGRIPDETEDQSADFVENGVSRTIRVDTSGGPVSATIVQAQFRPQFPVKVVNTGTGQLTVQANGGETINGQATIVINGPGYIDILADSTASNYIIIDEQLPQKMREKASSTVISSTFATLVWDVEDYNQFGTEISGGTFQANTAGFYHACAKVNVTGTFALNNNVDLVIDTGPTPSHYAEDKPVAGGAQTSLSASVCDDFLLAAGDKVRVQVSSTATSPAISGSATQNTFTVYRISD